jgi:ABC-type amino acid transport substrate-binding protein
MAKLQEAGKIKIGVKYDVPPFGFKNPQNNQIEGFDIDLGKRIAEELGVEPEFIEAVSDNRIPFLKDGTADLILSTMTINAERDEEIDFSEPYYVAKGRILTKKDDTAIKGVDDLANKKVCTALGSTYEETLKEQAPKADLRLVDSYSECLELIQNGAVDAISTDDVILTGMIIQDDSLKLVEGEELTTEPYGAGIKDKDAEFQKFVSDVVTKWKQDGGWADAYQKWVGQYTKEPQEPPTMTLREAIELSE